MKLRLTLELPRGALHDVTLACDVTATVADTARALIRAGVSGDREFEDCVARRSLPVTLRARAGIGAPSMLLDPAEPLSSSGLRSGWLIEAIPEFGPHSSGTRVAPIAGYIEVLSGAQAGATYSLIAGSQMIGRDTGSRVYLNDGSVSRRHVAVTIDSELVLRDLGSANGMLIDGRDVALHVVHRPCTVVLGDIQLRVTPGPPAETPPVRSHRVLHTRAPRVAPHFPVSERELPAPPAPATPSRIPMLAMLAPMLMGGVMFAVTQSPMSLIMVAFSPLMMVGAWVDGKLGGKRKLRRELEQFTQSLVEEGAELAALREQEIVVRAAETPSLAEVSTAISSRDSLLWARRPEHRSFLELRFGEGSLPSRTGVLLPPRGETAHEQWGVLRGLEREFGEVAPVPVLERLDRCGSIGVAGEAQWAEGMARALILQIVGLHSPAELALACFAGPGHAANWAWLKWLPHLDAVTSPLSTRQLADDPASSTRLIVALEGLLEARLAASGAGAQVRSHLDRETRNDDAQGEAVGELPTIPVVIVVVLDDGQIEKSRLIGLAERGPDCGIHLLWVSRSVATLPAACRTFVELGAAEGRVHFVRTGVIVPLGRIEFLEAPVALDLARRLAPVEDTSARVLDESDLPKQVQLRELHGTDFLGGSKPIVQAWSDSNSLIRQWRPGTEQDQMVLSAIVGQGPDGATAIDLRLHGPHALVGGTTGAGKSEFLQSWIMSMAARLSPDRLTFLLVDYKGGAAFAECTDLPHTVGLVTDLSPHLVRRALTSLRAELRYREELLAQHTAKDLITMERRSDAAAPPVLVIVIDEFAALASDVPEFVDGIIDVAQRGRSLGLHLILATQRPAGVIKDNLRANTNLRIALRMADESDSNDVLGVKDAAFFDAETPGRGAIKVGPGRISHFQTGYLGGRSAAAVAGAGVEVRSLSFAEGDAWDIPPEAIPAGRARTQPPRDIEQLRDGVIAAAGALQLKRPRRPWLDPLPELINLNDLQQGLGALRANLVDPADPTDTVVIGLRDDPAAQAQHPLTIDFDESGNIALFGAGGTGKTSTLITLAAALSAGAVARPVQIYAIDAGGGALDVLSVLPTVGAVAALGDLERVGRILQRLCDLIAERGPKYSAARSGGLAAYRATPGAANEALVVLMIDGFAAFRQATEMLGGATDPMQRLGEIMMTGRAVGIHVVLCADRVTAMPGAMASSVQQRFVLRLASPHDYAHLGVQGDALNESPPGRAIVAGETHEVQIALLGGSPDFTSQARAIETLAARLIAEGVLPAPQVRNAPTVVPLAELPPKVSGKPVFGINTQTFAPALLPVRGLGVIAGPAGSGLSTAALTCVEALSRWAAARGVVVQRVLLTFSPDGLRERGEWERVALGEAEVREVTSELVIALGGRPSDAHVRLGAGLIGGLIGEPIGSPIGEPIGDALGNESATPTGSAASPPAEQKWFPEPGARAVIVVERPADAEGTPAMPELVALAKVARRAGALVLFEWELDSGGTNWDLFSLLKQPGWGLSLQPDAGESQTPFRESLGRVNRADFPPGRGFAIENGRIAPVHVATSCQMLPDAPTELLDGVRYPGLLTASAVHLTSE